LRRWIVLALLVIAFVVAARLRHTGATEFGVDGSLPIYSGGLGVLAGDHLKAASDAGLPLVAIAGGRLLAQDALQFALDHDGRILERGALHKRVERLLLITLLRLRFKPLARVVAQTVA